MQGTSRKLKFARALPAFAWLIMQMLMTGVFLPSSADAKIPGLDSTVAICTPTGLKVISLADDPAEPGETTWQECDWCQAFGNTAPLVRSDTVSKVAFDFEKYSFQPAGKHTAADRFFGNIRAIRAPPL